MSYFHSRRQVLLGTLSLFAVFLVSSSPLFAQAPSNTNTPTLDSLKLEFDVHRAELMKPVAELKQFYQGKLTELLDEVTAAGDLKQALAVKAELTTLESDGRTQVEQAAFPELKRLEEIFVEAQSKRVAEVTEKMMPLVEAYLSKLGKLQKRLTQEKNLEEAVKVQAVVEEVKKGMPLPNLPVIATMEKKDANEKDDKDMMVGKTASFAHNTQTDAIIDVKFEPEGKAIWIGLGDLAVEWAYSVGETPLIFYFWSPSQNSTKETGFKLVLEPEGKTGIVTKVRGGFPPTEAKISRSRR